MTTPGQTRFVARLFNAATAFNTLNLPPPVQIFLHRSPAFPNGDVRGIRGLDFQVTSGGVVIQVGQTGADGKIDVRVPPGGSSTLQLMRAGAVVAEYIITVDSAALDPVSAVNGQQERLRLLGYQTGHAGANGDGVDGTATMEFERSVLDFQADEGFFTDGTLNAAANQPRLTTRAGG